MKQRTSVYLDDLDREAVQQVGEYYGITSDTDVLCFSVRAVARTLAKSPKKGEQTIMIPAQDNVLTTKKQWQVQVFTSKEDDGHIFYDNTMPGLRSQVLSWLKTVQPTYVSSKVRYVKEKKTWSPYYVESNEVAYAEFCKQGLDIKKGPEYEEQGFVDGKFQLEQVKTTQKEDGTSEVNRMLERGWHIIGLEVGQDSGRTWYVLGHTEEGAF